MISKLLEFIKSKQSEIVLALAVVLIAIISFETGKISTLRNFGKPLEIKDPLNQSAQVIHLQGSTLQKTSTQRTDQKVVASKNSTSYHFSWCSGAKKIKEENKIIFASEQEAQSKGLTLASNCQKW